MDTKSLKLFTVLQIPGTRRILYGLFLSFCPVLSVFIIQWTRQNLDTQDLKTASEIVLKNFLFGLVLFVTLFVGVSLFWYLLRFGTFLTKI